MFHNVCRLCLGTEELIWIFNDKMASNMPEIIEVTSGVQITKSDTVTQMVCNTCCQITIKMYKFRTTSIKNDKDLKARCAGYNISQLRNSIVQTKQEISTSSAAVYAASHAVSLGENKTTINASVLSNTSPPPPPTPSVPKFQIPQKYKFAHPSIKEILKQNPNIQLPEVSLKSHFGAYITLLTDEVDDWYKEKNCTDSEIAEIKKAAVNYAMELDSPGPQPQRKKRRKSSIESACSSSSKKSSSDKSVTESGGSKRKKNKLNGDISSPSKAETTADKVKGNSVPKPKPNLPKIVISVTKSAVSTTDKTNIEISSKPNASSTMTLESNSNSKIKADANIKISAKTDNIPKWGADVKSSASVKSNVTQNTVNTQSAKSDVSTTETSPKETLHMGTVLHSLLTKEKPSKGRHEEITLSSILREGTKSPCAEAASDSDGNDADDDPSYEPDPGDVGSDAEIIEIDEPGKNVPSIRTKTDQMHNRTKPKDEFTLFTTRPFVRNVRQSKLDVRTQGCQDAELLVLSDSDDDGGKSIQPSNKKADSDASDNSDPVIVDIDSPETSSLQSSKDNSDQNKTTNMPDLSLVTLTSKSNTLFICKVCDKHYSNVKDLKAHERKTHTKCPFCNKKFRSLSSRDEHVKYTCIINNAPFELKNLKLELTRVDEIEEIRKQYASAFEEMDYITEETISNGVAVEVTSTATVCEGVPKKAPSLPPQQPKESTRETTDCDKAISELEALLQTTPVPDPPSEQLPSLALTDGNSNSSETIAAESVAEVSANCDIICISDDEADISSTKEPPNKPKIKIINNDALMNINLQDHDTNVLRNILAKARLNKTGKTEEIDALKNNSIVDGGTTRVKVFKNLRKHLQHYKIPIEIQYSPNLNVEYKYATGPPRRKLTDLWYGITPRDLKVPKTHQSKPAFSNNTAVTTVPSCKNNNVASIPTSHVKTASLVMHSQKSGGVVSQIVTSTNNFFNAVSQSPLFATMGQIAPIVSSAASSSSKLIFASQTQPIATSTINDHSYSNRPMVLNNTQAVCATTNNITNFILVPSSLLQTSGKITESLPATQGPLPIIQYVTSAQEQPQTITIADESNSAEERTTPNITNSATSTTASATTSTITSATISADNSATTSAATSATTNAITSATTASTVNAGATQPAIRVKNLSELS